MSRSPRVRCLACSYEWFGATVEHGLRVLGCCPRCDGELEFLLAAEAPDADPAPPPVRDARRPAAVLGTPTSWAR